MATGTGRGGEDEAGPVDNPLDTPYVRDNRFETPHVKDNPLDTPYVNPFRNVGRNDPCPCGSGKKYKKCCMAA